MVGYKKISFYFKSEKEIPSQNSLPLTNKFDWVSFGGDKRTRTVHLLNAIQALYQMSYIPVFGCKGRTKPARGGPAQDTVSVKNYSSGLIAPTGQPSSQAPQSMQTSGSI